MSWTPAKEKKWRSDCDRFPLVDGLFNDPVSVKQTSQYNFSADVSSRAVRDLTLHVRFSLASTESRLLLTAFCRSSLFVRKVLTTVLTCSGTLRSILGTSPAPPVFPSPSVGADVAESRHNCTERRRGGGPSFSSLRTCAPNGHES